MKHPLESRPAELIVGRKIRATEKWSAIGQKKSCQRPAALSRKRADRRLVARIDVGPLVAIDFHRHKILIDDACDFSVLVALAVNHVTPVAPNRADIEQDRLVF